MFKVTIRRWNKFRWNWNKRIKFQNWAIWNCKSVNFVRVCEVPVRILLENGRKEERGESDRSWEGVKERERGNFGNHRPSNCYGFSGSNSPDHGNTSQFTHADCAREDVNSCRSDGPLYTSSFLSLFPLTSNRSRGRTKVRTDYCVFHFVSASTFCHRNSNEIHSSILWFTIGL